MTGSYIFFLIIALLLILFWIRQFMVLMSMPNLEFVGRYDKLI